MTKNVRLPRAVCAAVAGVLKGSHTNLEAFFLNSGAPPLTPELSKLSHALKWKEWLFFCGTNPECDSLAVLGNILEEFMDIESYPAEAWKEQRARLVRVLEENGFRYYRGGRVLPTGIPPEEAFPVAVPSSPRKPANIDELLLVLLKNLRRAMHPLTHRRKGAITLSFTTEYDVQDLLHALLRPWVADIRPEEFTPSYGGTSTRMDFLMPVQKTVIELKFVRDATHAKKVGDELTVDIDHYRKHTACDVLWCVVFDPEHLIRNAQGLRSDLEGDRTSKDGTVKVKVLVLT